MTIWFCYRFKQPIGEVVMTCAVGIVYLGTLVVVVLPRLDEVITSSDIQSKVRHDSIQFRKKCWTANFYFDRVFYK